MEKDTVVNLADLKVSAVAGSGKKTILSPHKIKRRLYLCAGFISLSVGLLGMVLPILATTPFLLLSAFCFARSSEKRHRWLLDPPVFGATILAFREKRGLTRHQKKTNRLDHDRGDFSYGNIWTGSGVTMDCFDRLDYLYGLPFIESFGSVRRSKASALGPVPK